MVSTRSNYQIDNVITMKCWSEHVITENLNNMKVFVQIIFLSIFLCDVLSEHIIHQVFREYPETNDCSDSIII